MAAEEYYALSFKYPDKAADFLHYWFHMSCFYLFVEFHFRILHLHSCYPRLILMNTTHTAGYRRRLLFNIASYPVFLVFLPEN